LTLGRGRKSCRLSAGAGSAASASLPRLIDQRQTELDLAGPGTPTTLSVLPEAKIRAPPSGATFAILTHDHALDFLLAVEASGVQTRPMSV
jgi:xanthine/CO dehydrogenase XdhC/CoxF family maturation factor